MKTKQTIMNAIRRARRAAGSSLAFLTVVALAAAAMPIAQAPEDPWGFFASVPEARGSRTLIAEVVGDFLELYDVRLPADKVYDIAESVSIESRRHGIDAGLLLSMIFIESSFREDVVSDQGAVGLMQLLPSTAEAVASELDLDWNGEDHLIDPRTNITLGAYYLKKLMRVFGNDVLLALTAYNKGPAYVLEMQKSGVMEATANDYPSSYAERVIGGMSRLYKGRGQAGRRAPTPARTGASSSTG
jgi:soluble lytic murein transglycosylase